MELVLFAIYIYAGGMANSFLKHHILKLQTVYVFSLSTFITEKIILAALLGWATIPAAIVMRLCGMGKNDLGDNRQTKNRTH